ncbi:MAG: hypothetical protein LBU80_04070 [Rikenellaceae bacterium]|jgi:hypothetical protein|nr:hypothetical protein [Rikenellaceae bacterium]
MKKATLILALAALTVSCGDGKLTLSQYNEKAVTAFNYFDEKIAADLETIFDNEMSTEEAQQILNGLTAALDSCTKVTVALAYPDDAKAFHESIMTVYAYDRDSLLPLLTRTIQVAPESDEWYDLWNQVDDRIERLDVLHDAMNDLQQELADKAGMELR